MKETIINGVKYKAVDTPIEEDTDFTCRECDIFKAKIPLSMIEFPLCCREGNKKVQESCRGMMSKHIKRLWKRV